MKNEIMWRRIHHSVTRLMSLIVLITLCTYTAKGQEDQQFTGKQGMVITQTLNPSDIADKVNPFQNVNVMEKAVTFLTEDTARIPPKPMSEMRDEWVKILDRLPGAGLKGLYTPVNVFGTLMYNPQTMASFLDY